MTLSRPIFPFRTLAAADVVPASDGWTLVLGDEARGAVADGGILAGWDAMLEFSLVRDFRITTDLGPRLGLAPGSECSELAVVASSANGLYRDVLFRAPVSPGESTITVTVKPSSARLARDLVLTTGIYLSRNMKSKDALAPNRAGARLWESTDRIRLEGGAARLPMYEVDFAKAFPGMRIDDADFHVEISDDSDLDFESAVAVYLNSRSPQFIRDLSRGIPAAERRFWSGFITRAIAQGLASKEILFAEGARPGTLGSSLQSWSRMIWGEAFDPQQTRHDSTSLLEAQIESKVTQLLGAKEARK